MYSAVKLSFGCINEIFEGKGGERKCWYLSGFGLCKQSLALLNRACAFFVSWEQSWSECMCGSNEDTLGVNSVFSVVVGDVVRTVWLVDQSKVGVLYKEGEGFDEWSS